MHILRLGSTLYLFKFQIKYAKELRCLNTKGEYAGFKFNFFSHLLILASVCFCNLLNHNCHLLFFFFFFFAEQLRLLALIISFAKLYLLLKLHIC